jgi:uncharacterized protein YlxW (UPF0749 family)
VATTRGWHGSAVLVLGAAGILIAAGISLADAGAVEATRGADLPDLVAAETDRVDSLEERSVELTEQVDALTRASADDPGSDVAEILAVEAERAGFVDVAGPGLTVSLNDAPVPDDLTDLPEGTTPDDFVVHQQDVEAVVNALWTGGAEAMQIMDRRITSVSAVRCVGNVIILDGQVYSPPFDITVIGDPSRLNDALDRSEQVQVYRDWADFIGLGYEVTEHEEVTIPGATTPTGLSSATPVQAEG